MALCMARAGRVVAVAAAATAWLCVPLQARAASPQWGLDVRMTAAAPWGSGEGRSVRLALEPSAKWRMAGADWRARERLRWLHGPDGRHTEADVREFSATWRGDDSSLALGAQQINWGRMDIVRVADLVNPVDQRDLFVEDMPQAKRSTWMANWEWQDGPRSLQVIVAPRPGIDRLPAEWAGLPVRAVQPATSLDNTTWAVRYGEELAGWSADLIGVRGWQTSPTLVPVVEAGGASLQAHAARQDSLAFSADKPVGTAVLRVEGLYARVKPVPGPGWQGHERQSQSTLGIGLDIRQGSWFFAGQMVAQHNTGTAVGAKDTALLSVIVQRKWLHDRLAARALVIHDTRSATAWGSLRLSWEQSANSVVELQADSFGGASSQGFGALRERSRIAASLRLQY